MYPYVHMAYNNNWPYIYTFIWPIIIIMTIICPLLLYPLGGIAIAVQRSLSFGRIVKESPPTLRILPDPPWTRGFYRSLVQADVLFIGWSNNHVNNLHFISLFETLLYVYIHTYIYIYIYIYKTWQLHYCIYYTFTFINDSHTLL